MLRILILQLLRGDFATGHKLTSQRNLCAMGKDIHQSFRWNKKPERNVSEGLECHPTLLRACGGDGREHPKETHMDTTTLLIIVLIILLLGGGGWYGRGRWY